MSQERSFVIGKNRSCDIVLGDESVSRQHAELLVLPDGKFFLTDTDSKNGTYILQGKKFIKIRKSSVTPSDIIRFGACKMAMKDILEYIHLKFVPLRNKEPSKKVNNKVVGDIILRCVHCASPKKEGEICEVCGTETRRYNG